MKLMPKEPTPEMIEAAIMINSLHDLTLEQQASAIYKAMYQAAPEVEQELTCDAGSFCIKCPDDRTPLSEEQLVLLWNGSTKEIPYEHFQAVFRFAEKAHSVGVE